MPDEGTRTIPTTPAPPVVLVSPKVPVAPVVPAALTAPATPANVDSPEADIEAIVNDRVNAKLATHKRTLQLQLKDAQTKATAYDQLQGQVGELLDDPRFEGVENLGDFRQAASDTIDQYKSEAERLTDEGEKQGKLLSDATQRADSVEIRYNTAMAKQAVTNEAAHLASTPASLKFIQQELAQFANAPDAEGGVTFDMPIKNEEGTPEFKKGVTAKEAVQALEADVTNYGPHFKSFVAGGTGSGGEAVDGVMRTQTGTIDFGKMSMEKYVELQSKNPEALMKSLMDTRL